MDSCSEKVNNIFLFSKLARTRKEVDFAWDTLSFFEVKPLNLFLNMSFKM